MLPDSVFGLFSTTARILSQSIKFLVILSQGPLGTADENCGTHVAVSPWDTR